jgi:hypothetical protein
MFLVEIQPAIMSLLACKRCFPRQDIENDVRVCFTYQAAFNRHQVRWIPAPSTDTQRNYESSIL